MRDVQGTNATHSLSMSKFDNGCNSTSLPPSSLEHLSRKNVGVYPMLFKLKVILAVLEEDEKLDGD
jgi:hypothetical protein